MLGPRLPGHPGPLQCVRDAPQRDQVSRRPVLAALAATAAAVPSVSPPLFCLQLASFAYTLLNQHTHQTCSSHD